MKSQKPLDDRQKAEINSSAFFGLLIVFAFVAALFIYRRNNSKMEEGLSLVHPKPVFTLKLDGHYPLKINQKTPFATPDNSIEFTTPNGRRIPEGDKWDTSYNLDIDDFKTLNVSSLSSLRSIFSNDYGEMCIANGEIKIFHACAEDPLEEAKEFYCENFEYIGSGKTFWIDGVDQTSDKIMHFFVRNFKW